MKHAALLSILLPAIAISSSHFCQIARTQQSSPVDIANITSYLSDKDVEVRREGAQVATQQPDARLLRVLTRALSDTDSVVRQRSAIAIRSIPGEQADSAAIQSFKNPDVVVRRELVRRFEGRTTPQAVKAIENLLNDSDFEVRNQVARMLYENPHQDAAAVLRKVLTHPDRRVRFYACARLEKASAAEAIPLLIARLDDYDHEVRQRALHGMRQLPEGAGDKAVLAAMKHRDYSIRQGAVDHFLNPSHQERTSGALEALERALSDGDNGVRQRVATCLRASKDSRATSIMVGALKHHDPAVRRQAIHRLNTSPNPTLINPLIAALNDLDREVRAIAAQALNRIDDPRAKAAAKLSIETDARINRAQLLAAAKTPTQLRLLFRHRDNDVRRMAAEALRRHNGVDATQVALSSLDNPDPIVRHHLIERLREKPDAAAVPHLVKATKSLDQPTRQFAINALRTTPGEEATQAILTAFQHEDALVRQRVVERFRDHPDSRALSSLVKGLKDWDPYVRREAAQALRRMDDKGAMNAALAAFDHPDVDVRNHVIHRFAERPDAQALPALVKILTDGDSRNWNSAAFAIRRIEGDPALQATFAMFNHLDSAVRNHAVGRFQDKPDARATALLARALFDSNVNVCRQAAIALRRAPGEDAKHSALSAFNHPDDQVRLHAVHRFIDQPDPSVTLNLIEKLNDENANVMRHVVRAIERSANAENPAPLVDLLYHDDKELRRIIAVKLNPIMTDPKRFAESPLSSEHMIDRMRLLPPIKVGLPTTSVELFGGDRIVGKVLGGGTGTAASGGGKHLLVSRMGFSVIPTHQGQKNTTNHARVRLHWIRRIVWLSNAIHRYSPKVIFLRDGSQLPFDAIRWGEDNISILQSEGTRRIPYSEIAELHLPERDSWTVYCEQLAALGCQPQDKLLRLDFKDGSRVTITAERFSPFSIAASAEPNEWSHLVHPAWCLDGLAAPHRLIGLRSWLPVTQVPLFSPRSPSSATSELWPWLVDRNVQGGPMISGGRQYRWGFGVHADNVLQFQMPKFATGFRTEVGLDQIVRNKGCARGLIQIRDQKGVKKLYRSPLLIGSESVLNTKNLTLPRFDGPAHLELIADSAARDRTAGADPLNIRDMVDWLEPTVLLDSTKLFKAVAEAAKGLEPELIQQSQGKDWRARTTEMIKEAVLATVSYTVEGRKGEGVLIGTGGYVLTAAHVLARKGLDVQVRLQDGRTFSGKTLSINRDTDLGLIGIGPQPNLPSLEVSNDDKLAQAGMYIGITRDGSEKEPNRFRSFTPSIIDSGLRTVRTNYFPAAMGSPLLNAQGQVVGIHTGRELEKYLQFSRVHKVPDEWSRMAAGEVWGIWLLKSSPRIGFVSTGTKDGARVTKVEPGSAAEKAGLKVDDLVYRLDGKPVLSYLDMEPIKGRKDADDSVTMGIKRGDQTLELKAKLMPTAP